MLSNEMQMVVSSFPSSIRPYPYELQRDIETVVGERIAKLRKEKAESLPVRHGQKPTSLGFRSQVEHQIGIRLATSPPGGLNEKQG
jgi:hypothetical protein